MKPRTDKKIKRHAVLQAVTAQAVKGQSFLVSDLLGGEATNEADLTAAPTHLQQEPFREIDGASVFHASCNEPPFAPAAFDVRKISRWGRMYHPTVVACSYEIGGEIRLYVDTRVDGFYVLWTATRVEDVSEFGSGAAYDLTAWTPRIPADTIKKAGFRLVHAALLNMLFVDSREWHCDLQSAQGFAGTPEAAAVIGAIAPTVHRSKHDLQARLAGMPTYLRSFYSEGASLHCQSLTYDL
jgi:hypothetical protein